MKRLSSVLDAMCQSPRCLFFGLSDKPRWATHPHGFASFSLKDLSARVSGVWAGWCFFCESDLTVESD